MGRAIIEKIFIDILQRRMEKRWLVVSYTLLDFNALFMRGQPCQSNILFKLEMI